MQRTCCKPQNIFPPFSHNLKNGKLRSSILAADLISFPVLCFEQIRRSQPSPFSDGETEAPSWEGLALRRDPAVTPDTPSSPLRPCDRRSLEPVPCSRTEPDTHLPPSVPPGPQEKAGEGQPGTRWVSSLPAPALLPSRGMWRSQKQWDHGQGTRWPDLFFS